MCRYEAICLSVGTPGGSGFREHILITFKVLTPDYVLLKFLSATCILNLNKAYAKTRLKYSF